MSSPTKNDLKDGEILSMLKAIEGSPTVTQRELSSRLNISLGKVNYVINALISRGLVKANTYESPRPYGRGFPAGIKKSNNKQAYFYILTPMVLKRKLRLPIGFSRRRWTSTTI